MVQECGAPQVYAQAQQRQQGGHAYLGGLPPVVEVAVHAYKCDAQHEAGPQHRAYPVDAEQGDIERGVHGSHQYHHHHHHQSQQGGHHHVHILPLCEEGGVDRGDAAELDGAVDHDIHVAEEDGHVAHRREPQLYGGVAREGGLHPEPARYEAGGHQHGHRVGVGAYHVGGDEHHAAREELYAVGVAELDAEHHGEVYGHAYKRGIAGHEDVFLHQCRRAHHIRCRGQVDAPGELDDDDKEDEYPGLEPPRYEVGHVGDVEGPLV